MSAKESEEDMEARRQHHRQIAEVYGPLDFEEPAMPALTHEKREQLVWTVSRSESLTNIEMAYCRFLKSIEMECSDPARAPYIEGCYIYGTYTINRDSCGSYIGEIEFPRSVTAIIPELPGFLKIRSRNWNYFFRNCARSFEPLEKQQLSIHVFEQESNLIPLMLKEMSRSDSHIYCYGVWHDPEIWNGDYTEVMSGYYWDRAVSPAALVKKMSFRGDYLVFMDAGSYYLQKISEYSPQGARIIEADFKKRR
jgi:hypothetical protein